VLRASGEIFQNSTMGSFVGNNHSSGIFHAKPELFDWDWFGFIDDGIFNPFGLNPSRYRMKTSIRKRY